MGMEIGTGYKGRQGVGWQGDRWWDKWGGGGGQVGRQVREQGVGHSGGQEDRLGQGGRV